MAEFDRARIVEIGNEKNLVFLPWTSYMDHKAKVGLSVVQNNSRIGEISINMTPGEPRELISDITTDDPDLEQVLEYIRNCLRAYRDTYAETVDLSANSDADIDREIDLLYRAITLDRRGRITSATL